MEVRPGLARADVTGDIDVEGDLTEGLRRAWRLARSHPGSGAAISLPGRMVAALRAVRLGAFGLPPRAPATEARRSGLLHTRRRDRAVIAHHHLSNDFHRLPLDDHMAHS
jgi:cyclopropane-fatty-acyl-phospholipid synthase